MTYELYPLTMMLEAVDALILVLTAQFVQTLIDIWLGWTCMRNVFLRNSAEATSADPSLTTRNARTSWVKKISQLPSEAMMTERYMNLGGKQLRRVTSAP
jgi:hypothetical protein